ncbi:hypothetical protein [Patulibacter sp. SYSU D01012]|uniref:hypothetical protein n=1 Tax=Patulibacter sp. SYSU D01012 TaxID=2817381 RepID=UPI001B3130E8|nr:hypothetical protein [Patulibacter sp. SYSU D01012]
MWRYEWRGGEQRRPWRLVGPDGETVAWSEGDHADLDSARRAVDVFRGGCVRLTYRAYEDPDGRGWYWQASWGVGGLMVAWSGRFWATRAEADDAGRRVERHAPRAVAV